MKSIFKKVAGIAFAATLAFGMIGCSNGIDIHEHTFATTYTSNETHHWYAATCEHTTEVKDKTEHSFGEWTIKVQPTETAEGKKERECSVCHYKAEETVAKLEIVKTPAFSVESGAVDSGTSVTITCATEGSKIYYTTDGSAPTASSTEYTAAISVTKAVTIKAIAVKDGMNDSVVASASYTIKGTVATPTFSVASAEVESGTSVTISCSTEGAKIYYTKDGSEPTASSTEYTAAISVTEAVTIKAIAVKSGMNDSVVASATYTIKGTVATPAFSVAAGAVNSGTSVTITCSTEGAKIYYTTDGSEPTASSTEYTAAISVTEAVTLKAIAIKSGMNDSAVASVNYTIPFSWYESPVDAVTGNAATATSTYIYFGVFPKTVLPSTSDVTVDETDSVTMGASTYYKGSDGNYYAKVKENCFGSSGYTYTDTTTVKQRSADSYRYFKVEPIKWKVLTTNYNDTGKALLLAEEILTANVPYYEDREHNRTIDGSTVYPNNYKHSQIRAYLNGLSYQGQSSEVTKWSGNGFLQTAFTATAQSKIATTNIDNGGDSTTDAAGTLLKADGSATDESGSHYPDNTCESTTDKIFLLSEKEVTTTAYGFAACDSYGQKNARIRFPTDYAKANYAEQDSDDCYGGCWWLRSPDFYYSECARDVFFDGWADAFTIIDGTRSGVVPALSLSL